MSFAHDVLCSMHINLHLTHHISAFTSIQRTQKGHRNWEDNDAYRRHLTSTAVKPPPASRHPKPAFDVGVLSPANPQDVGGRNLQEEATCPEENIIDCVDGKVRGSDESCTDACEKRCCVGDISYGDTCNGANACADANVESIFKGCSGTRACNGLKASLTPNLELTTNGFLDCLFKSEVTLPAEGKGFVGAVSQSCPFCVRRNFFLHN